LIFIQFLLITFYHLFFELAWNGQTPGKRRTGLRVIQSNGLPLTVSGAIIRNLVRLFDFMPILYGFGLIVLFATKNTQRLGDLAAKTVVIRERKQLTLTTLKENLAVQYWHIKPIDPLPYYIRVEHLTQDDRTVARLWITCADGTNCVTAKPLSKCWRVKWRKRWKNPALISPYLPMRRVPSSFSNR
jgi:hypothetical protein